MALIPPPVAAGFFDFIKKLCFDEMIKQLSERTSLGVVTTILPYEKHS